MAVKGCTMELVCVSVLFLQTNIIIVRLALVTFDEKQKQLEDSEATTTTVNLLPPPPS